MSDVLTATLSSTTHPKAPAMTSPMTTTMTTTTTTTLGLPAENPTAAATGAATTSTTSVARRVTFRRMISSEWIKFRTARSNIIAIGGAAAAAIGFGALFSSFAGSEDGPGQLTDNALSLSLGGFQLSQIIIAILGVALVAGEYQTGLIRTWFGSATDRISVLNAKVTVYAGLVFAVSLAAAVVAFLVGQAALPAGWEALTLGSDGVLQALFGTALYASAVAAVGIGLGFLLRSTAAGAGVVVTTLMIAPGMVGLLPESVGDAIGKILPSNAGNAVQGLESSAELLPAGWAAVVLLGWVVAVVGAAAVSLRRRDA